MDTPIPASIPLEELLALSVLEKIAVIGVLWDSIDERDSIPIPDWQLEELDRRAAEDEANPEPTIPWEGILQRIKGSPGK
jgi:putative addiction module component (TIGR02574 family)